jgi:hypothetical protein
LNVELHLAADARESSKMRRELNSDHGSVWTSTESTAGKSRTMGAQESPASADASDYRTFSGLVLHFSGNRGGLNRSMQH